MSTKKILPGVLPNSTFRDAIKDPNIQDLWSSDQLSNLRMTYDSEKVNIVLKVTDGIETELIHNFYLRIWDGKEFKRIAIKVQENSVEYLMKANNSLNIS